ncbi:hypothetical protein Ahy_A05g024868 isoform A [Arachis hypogaea]|uniref:Anthocyanidin 3-O-glucosyltransferase n=1 Tax=Arachis hypogaea TaxID=3818 RepID=A0A445D791_ARAHY|nr:hypothetical protein Ahy_A05g024868 isoform A [Arachis hypogaea]
MQYWILYPFAMAYFDKGPRQRQSQGNDLTESDLMKPPPGFPASSDRFRIGRELADAIGFKGCREIDGPYTDFLENFYKKPCLLSGPLLPEPSNIALEEKWKSWLDRFKPGFEEALPEGFKERGVVYSRWVQQQLVLEHPSVGCFITHCGSASITEALGEEDGLFTKESVFKAVKIVMDDESEVGRAVRENHSKVKNFLLTKDFETSCLDSFCRKLQDLL